MNAHAAKKRREKIAKRATSAVERAAERATERPVFAPPKPAPAVESLARDVRYDHLRGKHVTEGLGAHPDDRHKYRYTMHDCPTCSIAHECAMCKINRCPHAKGLCRLCGTQWTEVHLPGTLTSEDLL